MAYEKEKQACKAWQFWCVWEGYDVDELEFDDTGLEEGQQISYSEYMQRKTKSVDQ